MRSTRALLAGGAGLAVACLAACGGGSGLLSGDQAANLSNHLDQLSSAVSSHHCGQASARGGALQQAVVSLPPNVNPTVRSNLSQGASTVAQLALHQCQQTTTSSTTTSSTSSTTTSSITPTVTSTSLTTTTSSSTSSATSNTGAGNTSTGSSGGGGVTGVTTAAGGGGGGGY